MVVRRPHLIGGARVRLKQSSDTLAIPLGALEAQPGGGHSGQPGRV